MNHRGQHLLRGAAADRLHPVVAMDSISLTENKICEGGDVVAFFMAFLVHEEGLAHSGHSTRTS
jgi:hypothetical protein